MSTTDIPSGFIKHQSLTTLPVTSDATLVDDTVRLVDDTTALVGGPASVYEGIKAKAEIPSPSARIKTNR